MYKYRETGRKHTELMSQDSHNLRLLALLYKRIVQDYALVLEEAIPAHALSYLESSYLCIHLIPAHIYMHHAPEHAM